VCIFVQKDLNFNKTDISYNCQEEDLEICAVEVETEASELIRLNLQRAV
jgi:membrane-bound inhibitor of C-type lysozyme